MTIDEAIKLNEELKSLLPEVGFNKYVACIRLGIQALKRVRDYKKAHIGLHYTPMPGETEE